MASESCATCKWSRRWDSGLKCGNILRRPQKYALFGEQVRREEAGDNEAV